MLMPNFYFFKFYFYFSNVMSMLIVSVCCLCLAGAGVRTKENTVQLGFKSKPSSKVKTECYLLFKKGESQVPKVSNCEIFQKYDFSVCRSYSGHLSGVLLVVKFSFSSLKSDCLSIARQR